MITTEGKDKLLNVNFDAALASTSWYIGLIDANGYVAIVIGDTLASHTGWNEAAEARLLWDPLLISNGVIQNTTPVEFTITADVTIQGTFLCDVSTGTAGTLLGTDIYSTPKVLTAGSTLNVTTNITL